MTTFAPAETLSIDDALSSLHASLRRAREWMLAHVGEDGRPAAAEEKNGYYRMPWTLAHIGERDTAAKVLTWIENNALTDAGDLQEGTPRADFTSRGATYPLSLIASGAWLLERYDTANAIMATLRQLRNTRTGGAYWERPEARITGFELAYPTAQLGLTALMTGHADLADDAYAWFVRYWKAQPGLPEVLYTAWKDDGLVLDPPPSDRFRCIVDFRQPRQAFYNPGIAASFLSRYAQARGNDDALNLAIDVLSLSERATPDQFNYWESIQVCKFGWGSAVAYEASRTERYLDNVRFMADWYRKSQLPDGSWVPSGFLSPEPSVPDAMFKTSEHALWISMMITGLAGRGRRIHFLPAG